MSSMAIDILQARYDRIVAEIAQAIKDYDKAYDGTMDKVIADDKMRQLNAKKCEIEREFGDLLA